MPSPWPILLLSSLVELLLWVRPVLPGGTAVQLFGDLAFQTFLLFVVPALWIRRISGKQLGDFGLHVRAPRNWQSELLILAAILVPIAILLTRVPSIHVAYPRFSPARSQPWLLLPSTGAFAIYGLAWEFFFRGWLLHGLRPRFGSWAILIQAIPCAFLHAGKPNLELLGSFPVAVGLGILALRWGSVVPGFLLHITVALAINLGCVFWPL